MKPRIQCLAVIGVLTLSSIIVAAKLEAQAPEGSPAPLDIITTAPASRASLETYFVENHDGDGEGEEQPSSITYYTKTARDFGRP